MNLSNLTQFQSMTPTEIVSQLQEEMKNPLFRKVAVATFSDTKYFLKPEAFRLHLSKKLPNPESVGPLTTEWAGWTVLDAMASGTLSGNAAKDALALEYDELDDDGQQIVMMILDKTWRNGVTQNTINEACPGTFRPAKFMLAHKMKDRLAHDARQREKGKPETIQWPLLATYKYDGFRAAFHQGDQTGYSRKGNPFPLSEGLKDALRKLGAHLAEHVWADKGQPLALDGELFAGTWKATAETRAVGYDHMVIFGVMRDDNIYGEGETFEYDVISLFEEVQRFAVANHLTRYLSVPKHAIVETPQDVERYFQKAINEGFEGLVCRPLSHAWESKRSYLWLKVKAEETEDLKIVGWEMADDRSRHAGKIGALLVERNGIQSGASGMPDELRDKLTAMGTDIIGLTAEINYHELTPDGKLRHAVVKKIRFDKDGE